MNAVWVRESALVDELSYVGAQGTVEGQYQHADVIGQTQPSVPVDARCTELPQPQQGYRCLATARRPANQPEAYSVIG